MNGKTFIFGVFVLFILLAGIQTVNAVEAESPLEKSMSDTLDVWRDGRYEQLFEQLAHRGKTSRETFVNKMRTSTTHPACCWQKMENFKIMNEKRTEATVYVKIGFEGSPDAATSTTREFKMTHQDGVWKMQLADVLSLAGVSGKKIKGVRRHTKKTSSHYSQIN